jgi:Thrombospondin type 3 repeat
METRKANRINHGTVRTALCAAIAFTLTIAAPVAATNVLVFDNPSYVDTAGGTSSESDNIQASLTSLGHAVATFTDITDTGIAAAIAGKDVLLIPELENGDLAAALSSAAKTTIANFVASGHGLIVNRDYTTGGQRDSQLLNAVFGFSLTTANLGGVSTLQAGAAGTSFAGGPVSLPANDGLGGITSALPGGGLEIYKSGTTITVARLSYGSGRIVFLGWDWYDAAPAGSQDSGWLTVLDDAVNDISVCNQAGTDTDGDGAIDVCDNCPAVANPGQEDGNGDGIGDACNPQVSIDPFTTDGSSLSANVAASSPIGLGLSGTVAIWDTSCLPTDVTFTWLATNCDPQSNFELTVNGTVVANPPADPAGFSCTCVPPQIGTFTVPLSEVLANVVGGVNNLGIRKIGGNTALAWAYATITINGTPTRVEIFDQSGGNSYDNPDLCASGYTGRHRMPRLERRLRSRRAVQRSRSRLSTGCQEHRRLPTLRRRLRRRRELRRRRRRLPDR